MGAAKHKDVDALFARDQIFFGYHFRYGMAHPALLL